MSHDRSDELSSSEAAGDDFQMPPRSAVEAARLPDCGFEITDRGGKRKRTLQLNENKLRLRARPDCNADLMSGPTARAAADQEVAAALLDQT